MTTLHEDVADIAEKKPVAIWGAGHMGHKLLQEIRVHKVKNVYICDSDEVKTQGISERITLEQIRLGAGKMAFVISVQDDRAAEEISMQIRQYGMEAEIYRYVPKDGQYMDKVLAEKGFFNGNGRVRALEPADGKKLLEQRINDGRPFLLSRWGSIEGETVYAAAAGLVYDGALAPLKRNAGFYPLDRDSVYRYAECSANAAKEIDILMPICTFGCLEDLYMLYSPDAVLVTHDMMCPFFEETSWTGALRGKKVLAIHPFAKLMEEQYKRRDKLFSPPDILPEMELVTYQAVQSMGGNPEYKSWFDALEKMENDIRNIDFDVALIGCGAYGMPLGAFIKSQMHKKAIHIGGSLQLLFGIKGRRWEIRGGGYDYDIKLYNEHWVRPTDDLKPKNYKDVEGGCYW